MAETVTLEQVEKLMEQLTPAQQLKLVECLISSLTDSSSSNNRSKHWIPDFSRDPEKLTQVMNMSNYLSNSPLAARICEKLSAASDIGQVGDEIRKLKQKRLRLIDELLSEVNNEDDSRGEFDSATDLRQLREERGNQICQSDA